MRGVGTKRWYEVHGLPATEYPEIPQPGDMPALEIPAATLAMLALIGTANGLNLRLLSQALRVA